MPHTCQPKGLGEGLQDDQVGVGINEGGQGLAVTEVDIGLVHHHDLGGVVLDHGEQVIPAQVIRSRVVGRAQKDHLDALVIIKRLLDLERYHLVSDVFCFPLFCFLRSKGNCALGMSS